MLVEDIKNTISQYKNFEIWDIENMEAFFSGNGVIKEIFEKEYKIKIENFSSQRSKLPENDLGLIANILSHIGDKHFFLFVFGNENHLDLIELQEMKIMNFGVDIKDLNPSHYYVLIMDK
ncbi:MAG: hypothetical protein ACK5B9_06600 [Flavobacteriia bacterium]